MKFVLFLFNFGFIRRQLQEPGYYWPILSKLASNFQAMKLESFLDDTDDTTTTCSSSCSSHLCVSLVRDEEVDIDKQVIVVVAVFVI